MTLLNTALWIALFAAPAAADPLADMAGDWRGSGWARETISGPQEPVRCQITNRYEDGTLAVSGRCAVPGRKIALSGKIIGTQGSERITGQWFNPDGIGSTPIVGIQRKGVIAFNFAATDPATGHPVAQNVEWRITPDALHLRATDRADPSVQMSDVVFNK